MGQTARVQVDHERRSALSSYHIVLHALNSSALRDYNAWITGAHIGVDYARIDFKCDGFSPALHSELQHKVNAELAAKRCLRAYSITEEEFSRHPDLLSTLEVRPPVVEDCVRVVEMEGFDVQARGGTHVDNTGQLGRFTITQTENKGRINRRL